MASAMSSMEDTLNYEALDDRFIMINFSYRKDGQFIAPN